MPNSGKNKRKAAKAVETGKNTRKRSLRNSEEKSPSKQQSPLTTPKRKQRKTENKSVRRVLIKDQSDKNNNATNLIIKAQSKSMPKATSKKDITMNKIVHNSNSKVAKGSKGSSANRQLADDILVSVGVESEEEEELDYDDHDLLPQEDAVPNNDYTDVDSEVVEMDENDPKVQQLLNKLIKEKVKSGELQVTKGNQEELQAKKTANVVVQSCQINAKNKQINRIVKSPSDTTIYAPAVKRLTPGSVTAAAADNGRGIDHITNFIHDIRLNSVETRQQEENKLREDAPLPGTSSANQQMNTEDTTDSRAAQIQQARDKASKLIIDAEQFKALIDDPRGEISYQKPNNWMQVAGMNGENHTNDDRMNGMIMNEAQTEASDDTFFHITCHIEPALRSKIEKGEFVDLEKLLPKNRMSQRASEGRLEWVSREGMTFLAPVEKEGKISNVRKWEQAFRVYAAIYSRANPHRSAEIWQYVFVINSAATAYQWDNVANYDYTFRQLMAANPQRSWARTYTQFWSLSMREPINRGNNGYSNQNSNWQNNRSSDGNGHKFEGKKKDHCWKFNKFGNCNKGSSCGWKHKCKYCDATSHGYNTCAKKGKQTPPGASKPHDGGNVAASK